MLSGPQTDTDLHEEVSICGLLQLAGLVRDEDAGWRAIAHGNVKIEQWTISLHEGTLPRWILRGVTISIGERSMTISQDGTRIVSEREGTLA